MRFRAQRAQRRGSGEADGAAAACAARDRASARKRIEADERTRCRRSERQLRTSKWSWPTSTLRSTRRFTCRSRERQTSSSSAGPAEGTFVTQWRDIVKPTDIWFNKQEIAYVSEQRPSISIMDRSGKVLARFDTPGSGHALWVDSAGDIYLAEAGGRRLTKYIHKR